MRLTPFQISLCLSVLVHGGIVGGVYAMRHPGGNQISEPEIVPIEVVTIAENATESAAPAVVEKVVVAPQKVRETPVPTLAISPVDQLSRWEDDLELLSTLQTEHLKQEAPAPVATTAAVCTLPQAGTATNAVFHRAAYLDNPKPAYPQKARKLRQEGLVVLGLKLNDCGDISNVLIARSSGHPLLDDAAVATMKRWHFTPARLGEKAVESEVEVPIRFKLSN